MSPYLLTVLSSANTVCCTAMIISMVVAGVSGVVYIACSSSYEKEERASAIKVLRLALTVLAVVSGLFCFVPSQEKLRDAYIMSEVAKIATADNAKATAEVLLQRIDKLLELQQSKK